MHLLVMVKKSFYYDKYVSKRAEKNKFEITIFFWKFGIWEISLKCSKFEKKIGAY